MCTEKFVSNKSWLLFFALLYSFHFPFFEFDIIRHVLFNNICYSLTQSSYSHSIKRKKTNKPIHFDVNTVNYLKEYEF